MTSVVGVVLRLTLKTGGPSLNTNADGRFRHVSVYNSAGHASFQSAQIAVHTRNEVVLDVNWFVELVDLVKPEKGTKQLPK